MSGEFRLVAVYSRDGLSAFACVDAADFALVNQYRWRRNKDGYVVAGHGAGGSEGKRDSIRMHRLVASASQVDHRNGNRLDNRRENLRPCTSQQNSQNRRRAVTNKSGYKGVTWRDGKWRARIRIPASAESGRGKQIELGRFDTAAEAHAAYCAAALKYYGEFANDGTGPIKGNP